MRNLYGEICMGEGKAGSPSTGVKYANVSTTATPPCGMRLLPLTSHHINYHQTTTNNPLSSEPLNNWFSEQYSKIVILCIS